MENYFRGKGNAGSKFPIRLKHIIQHLITNPRASANQIHKAYQGLSIPGWGRNIPADGEDGLENFISEVLGVRLDIVPARYTSGSGTCFVYAKLKAKSEEDYARFENVEIREVEGVIEWDRISGRNKDYLIRVVGGVGHDIALRVCEKISECPLVEEAYMADDITIWKSGVVNNIKAEHFFEFEE